MGEMGELVVTDLFNYAMPLIRYRTGDMVRLGLPSPGSRSNWRQIVEVGGRVVDMIQRVDGSTVSGEALIMALRSAGVRTKVQVVQETPVRLRVLHLREDTFPPDLLNNFITKAGEILRGQVEVVLEPVMELPYDRSGKYRYVTSRCHRAGYVRNNIAEDIKDR
jgi:phenylacetate-CoA ligase